MKRKTELGGRKACEVNNESWIAAMTALQASATHSECWEMYDDVRRYNYVWYVSPEIFMIEQ